MVKHSIWSLLIWPHPARFKTCLVTWPHCDVIITCHCHCVCLDTKWLSRDKQFKCTFKQKKLLVKTLGRWQYKSRNSSPWRYKFKKIQDKNKNHTRSVFCSTRTHSEITKAETLSPKDSGFLLGDFFGGSDWTEYLTRWFLLSYIVNSTNLIPVPSIYGTGT